jgi:hypothetical protein
VGENGQALAGCPPFFACTVRLDTRKSNLCFDDDHLLITAGFQEKRIFASLDTVALTTDLYETFAKEFATLVSKSGENDSTEVRGVGNAESFDSITLPELTFSIGGTSAVLRPAHVLLKQIRPKQFVGNFGMDLLKQARAFKIDFGAMKLELDPHPYLQSARGSFWILHEALGVWNPVIRREIAYRLRMPTGACSTIRSPNGVLGCMRAVRDTLHRVRSALF